jgi:hypothetical protein
MKAESMAFRRPFLVRSKERDLDTDTRRFARLRETVDALSAEVAYERTGLEARYQEASGDASFAQQQYEDGDSGNGLTKRIDELTATIMRVTARLQELDRQAEYLEGLKITIARFMQERT